MCGFEGKCLPQLAPKLKFWTEWHNNIGKIPEEDNIRYYIEQYYKQVLSKIDIEQLLEHEKDPILLCYEDSNQFCHRHIVAEYIRMKYGLEVYEIEIDNDLNIKINERPQYIHKILEEIVSKEMPR